MCIADAASDLVRVGEWYGTRDENFCRLFCWLLLRWNSGITDDDQSIEHCNALLQDVPRRQSLMKRWRLECSRPRSPFDATEQQISSRERYGLATVWHDELAQYLINGMGWGAGQGVATAAAAKATTGFWRRKRTSSTVKNESTYAQKGGSVRRRNFTPVSPEALHTAGKRWESVCELRRASMVELLCVACLNAVVGSRFEQCVSLQLLFRHSKR